jgi:hypothetical protein
MYPFWLDFDERAGRFEKNDQAQWVKQAFLWAQEVGSTTIARRLKAQGIRCPTDRGKALAASRIVNLLKDRAVLGEQTPIVAFLRPDGGVIYFADRHNMPSRDRLHEEIKTATNLANNAVPAVEQPEPQAEVNSQDDWQETPTEDCVDGSCDVDVNVRTPLFPRLRPVQPKPAYPIFGGWLSNSIQSGIFMIASIIGLGGVCVVALFLLISMVVLSRWIR